MASKTLHGQLVELCGRIGEVMESVQNGIPETKDVNRAQTSIAGCLKKIHDILNINEAHEVFSHRDNGHGLERRLLAAVAPLLTTHIATESVQSTASAVIMSILECLLMLHECSRTLTVPSDRPLFVVAYALLESVDAVISLLSKSPVFPTILPVTDKIFSEISEQDQELPWVTFSFATAESVQLYIVRILDLVFPAVAASQDAGWINKQVVLKFYSICARAFELFDMNERQILASPRIVQLRDGINQAFLSVLWRCLDFADIPDYHSLDKISYGLACFISDRTMDGETNSLGAELGVILLTLLDRLEHDFLICIPCPRFALVVRMLVLSESFSNLPKTLSDLQSHMLLIYTRLVESKVLIPSWEEILRLLKLHGGRAILHEDHTLLVWLENLPVRVEEANETFDKSQSASQTPTPMPMTSTPRQSQSGSSQGIKRLIMDISSDEDISQQSRHERSTVSGKRVRLNDSSQPAVGNWSAPSNAPPVVEDMQFDRRTSWQACVEILLMNQLQAPMATITKQSLSAILCHVRAWVIIQEKSPEKLQPDHVTRSLLKFVTEYLDWAVEIHLNPSRDYELERLRISFPWILSIASSAVSLALGSDDLKIAFICATSLPWCRFVAQPEFWDSSTGDDEDEPRKSFAQTLLHTLSGPRKRLQHQPDVLTRVEVLSKWKQKAIFVMATIPFLSALQAWREFILTQVMSNVAPESMPVRMAIVQSLPAFCAVSPLPIPVLETIVSSALEQHDGIELVEALSGQLGAILCALDFSAKSPSHKTQPMFVAEPFKNQLFQVLDCPVCTNSAPLVDTVQLSNVVHGVDFSFTKKLCRLVPKLTRTESRISVLHNLAQVFCHVDLRGHSLRDFGLGEFCLDSLRSKNTKEQYGAGFALENLVKRVLADLRVRPHIPNVWSECLQGIGNAFSSALEMSSYSFSKVNLVRLAFRVIRHLPEANATYRHVLGAIVCLSANGLPSVQHAAWDMLQELATFRKTKKHIMLLSCTNMMCHNIQQELDADRKSWFDELQLYAGSELKDILQACMGHLLPTVILNNQYHVIQRAATMFGKTSSGLCMDFMEWILAFVALMEDSNDILMFVESLKAVFQEHPGKAPGPEWIEIEALSIPYSQLLLIRLYPSIASDDTDVSTRAEQSLLDVVRFRKETQTAFFNLFVPGLLADINKTVVQAEVAMDTKATYVRGLPKLIRLLKPVPPFALSSVVKTLKAGLKVKEIQQETLIAMNEIIHMNGVPPLNDILGQITHSLGQTYSTVAKFEQEIILDSLKYIFGEFATTCDTSESQEDIALFSNTFAGLGALPDDPHFDELNQTLQKVKSKESVQEQLRRLIARSKDEEAELAEVALIELKALLKHQEEGILSLCGLPGEGADPVIGELMYALFAGIGRFKGQDTGVPRRCGECVGAIGPVDPSKLSIRRFNPSRPVLKNFEDEAEARDFAMNLLVHQLIGSRTAADIKSEGFLPLVIQEILKYLGWTSKDRSLERRWRSLDKSMQQTIQPFLTSTFKRDVEMTPTDQPASHTGSPQGALYPQDGDFSTWLAAFTTSLIQQLRNPIALQIFRPCLHIVNKNINMCTYILPYLVLHIVIEGSDDEKDNIVKEMLSVLSDGQSIDHLRSGTLSRDPSEKNQLACQTVFALFDHSAHWARARRIAMVNAQARNLQSQSLPVDDVLEHTEDQFGRIPKDVLALAALRCKAYARSAFYFEQHVQHLELNKSQDYLAAEQQTFEKMQELYVSMEEPDCMLGISTLVTSDDLHQQLLVHESEGRWEEASQCYELLLHEQPFRLDYHEGVFRCLKNIGKSDQALVEMQRVGREATLQQWGWESTLNAHQIETYAELQDWDIHGQKYDRDELLEKPHDSGFGVSLSLALQSMYQNDADGFTAHIQEARSTQIAPLAATSMETYARGYEAVVKLSILHEVEAAHKSWNAFQERDGPHLDGHDYVQWLQENQKVFDARTSLMMSSFRMREQVARVRRIAFYEIRIPAVQSIDTRQQLEKDCGNLWLETAKGARHTGEYDLAHWSSLQAEQYKNSMALIEKAKWEYASNYQTKAIRMLSKALRRVDHGSGSSASSSLSTGQPHGLPMTRAKKMVSEITTADVEIAALQATLAAQPESSLITIAGGLNLMNSLVVKLSAVKDNEVPRDGPRFFQAQGKALLAQWMDEMNSATAAEIIHANHQAIRECEQWERPYLQLANYYLRQYDNHRRVRRNTNGTRYLTLGFKLLGKALTLSPDHLYDIMPRLLTIWLDLGEVVSANETKTMAPMLGSMASGNPQWDSESFQMINCYMEELSGILPAYMFLAVFPQIISRIGHKDPDAFNVLQRIIINVILQYPEQAIWQMVPISQSKVHERSQIGNRILNKVRKEAAAGVLIHTQIMEAVEFCKVLIEFTDKNLGDKPTKVTLSGIFPRLAEVAKTTKHRMIVPTQAFLWPTLPESSKTMASHLPFSQQSIPRIAYFLDEVEIMSSLQKPRKLTIVGTDGKHYIFLCKPKDDLRKDSKLMEFHSLVNVLLKKDREAVRRNLYIRTYAAVPLNEECGMIEWVPNTLGFRHIVMNQYRLIGIYSLPMAEFKPLLEGPDAATRFVNVLLPKCPKVFGQWLIDISADPTEWFQIRANYVKTLAVTSMTGYVLGLGDRHGENILFDRFTGDCVHVDFNCLFDQGLTFPKPEKVPFRLTHNLVHACGVTGVEGSYRKCAEITYRVMRENTVPLMSLLEGFVHDPLVEWSKKKKFQQDQDLLMVPQPPLNPHGVTGAPAAVTTHSGIDLAQREKAKSILKTIRRKIHGETVIGSSQSVEGHVAELIRKATHPQNLSQMYVGWSSFL